MGAWGFQTFEDDCALDWVYDFEEQNDKILFLQKTFQTVINRQGEELETDEGSWVLAAAEVLAALKGAPVANLPEELATWVEQNPSSITADQIQQAIKAITIIKNPEHSEIAALWEESEDNGWLESVADLETRLQR